MLATPPPAAHSHNPVVRYFRLLGPGLVTGAVDDDPGGIILEVFGTNPIRMRP